MKRIYVIPRSEAALLDSTKALLVGSLPEQRPVDPNPDHYDPQPPGSDIWGN